VSIIWFNIGVSKTNIEKEEIMEKLIVELLQADTDRIHNSSNFEVWKRNFIPISLKILITEESTQSGWSNEKL
jgi:hypothetical protein